MPLQYQRRISPSLQTELKRLKSGREAEKQRYQNALSAMNKVMSNPVHPEFRKDLPQNYKAADVLQQYRIFFRIVPVEEATDVGCEVVYFVWINDENSLHRSGERDDTYQIFRGMIEHGEVDPYVPVPRPTNERFEVHDAWGADFIYVSFRRKLGGDNQYADSNLILQKTIGNSYRIQSVTVSDEGVGLASQLLTRLCDAVDQRWCELTFELEKSDVNFGKSRHLLEKFGFEYDDVIEQTEIWTRQARL
jgi:Toxin with endonuclease activity, of toxin-antitoxin system